jgi:acetyl esterase/lipase
MGRAARRLATLALGAALLARVRVRSGALDPSLFLYAGKLAAGVAAPVVGATGAASAVLGLLEHDLAGSLAGALAAALAAHYLRRVTAPHSGFERAFGAGWPEDIPPELRLHLTARRWAPRLPAPAPARLTKDLPFWPIPDRDRPLLADLWQPPEGTSRSGLGVIYLHAGGWQNYDKDTGTRPFFGYLAGQGHLVMDVAYRMCAETDMLGMVADAKRAVAWLHDRSGSYGLDPRRIVVMGASAGGQLALLAAYTPGDARLEPAGVRGLDTSVRGVVAYYAPADMLRYGSDAPAYPDWPAFVRLGRRVGIVPKEHYYTWPDVERRLYGGLAREAPEQARLFSPLTHVRSGCPPTLLIHGAHDRIVPAERSRELCGRLRAAGVPTVYSEIPYADHAFDLALLRLSAPAQAAFVDVSHFLALLAGPREFASH